MNYKEALTDFELVIKAKRNALKEDSVKTVSEVCIWLNLNFKRKFKRAMKIN